jgi:hypothetical protein
MTTRYMKKTVIEEWRDLESGEVPPELHDEVEDDEIDEDGTTTSPTEAPLHGEGRRLRGAPILLGRDHERALGRERRDADDDEDE